jgi:hypothetical protein
LERLLIAEERRENIEMGLAEENEIRNEFCMGLPITREKNEAAYFCYLLIDPSKIPSMQNCIFREFISAIFYVGKGKRSRPLQHLCDATKFRQNHVEQVYLLHFQYFMGFFTTPTYFCILASRKVEKNLKFMGSWLRCDLVAYFL